MIKQTLKLVWNRKRTTALIVVEIFFSFLVLCAVMTAAAYYADNYRHPLGFSYQGVWNIKRASVVAQGKENDAAEAERLRQLMMALRNLPEIEAAGALEMTPFEVGANNSDAEVNHHQIDMFFNSASVGMDKVLGIEMRRGRWFQQGDEALNYEPLVINESFSRAAFPGEDPIGKVVFGPPRETRQWRVIGVISDFRQHGEFHSLYNYYFQRQALGEAGGRVPRNLLVKLRPGVGAEFEEKLMKALQAVDRETSFAIEPLTKLRASHMRLVLTPVIAGGIVAVFLILMVGLGMVGVLWQSVTRRAREIGLRRAVGSPAGAVHKQILGELVVVTSVGIALGAAIAIQFPLLGILGFLSAKVYAAGIAVSVVVIYALALLAGLYPSWLATQVQPAEVLHYE